MTRRALAAGVALTLLAGAASGQVPGTVPAPGSEFFRFALHLKGLKPLADPQDALTSAKTTVIIIRGDTGGLRRYFGPERLQRYFADGGAVLLATDDSIRGGFGWERVFGFTVAGGPLTADPRDCYQGAATRIRVTNRPFVRPLDDRDRRGRPLVPLFADVPERGDRAIATDRPAELTLRLQGGNVDRLPLAAYPLSTSRPAGGALPDEVLFAAAFRLRVGAGRMLVLADKDVFANGMMGFEEARDDPQGFRLTNGNWEFADRAISWLKEGPPRLRTECLFIEDGTVIDQFAVQLPKPPRPPVPNIPPEVLANWLLRSANGIIQEKQEENALNRALLQRPGLLWFLRAFLIAVTGLFLFYAVRWLLRGYRRAEPAAVTGPAQQAALLPRGGVLRQRTAAQIEVGNLSEAVGHRVRDRFDVLGGRPGPAGGMPPVLVANDVPDAPLLRQTVRRLWDVGYGGTPVNVPPTEWDRVNGLLERVTARAARGDWSFGQDVA